MFGFESILLIVFYILIINITLGTSDCGYTHLNATYDLRPLMLTAGGQSSYYKVHDSEYDKDNGDAHNFTYLFNICEQTLSYPTETHLCENSTDGYCPQTSITSNGTCNTDEVPITDKAYVYQIRVTNHGDHCFHLSNSAENDYSFSLMDNNNPAKGVVLTYINGDWCSTAGVNREFRIQVECENDMFNVPDSGELVDEVETCLYNFTLQSIYGCPAECGIYANSLCASQGVCDYDFSNIQARCFCFYGYSGDDCSTYDSTSETISPDTKIAPDYTQNTVHTFTYKTTIANPTNGETEDAYVNVTYDLSPFSLSNEVFIVDDSSDTKWKYYWNVLTRIATNLLPDACKSDVTDACEYVDSNITKCTNVGSVSEGVGNAFQYNNASNKCFLLGTSQASDEYEWSLLDSDHPAKGVILTYTKGGWDSDCQKNRKFRIEFECPDTTRDFYDPSKETTISEYVDEVDECEYQISYETALACPYECITDAYDTDGNLIENEFTVCSSKGICAADTSAGVVRCLCDIGWTGSDCNTVDTSSNGSSVEAADYTGFQVAIAIILLVVIALVGILVWLKMKYNQLQRTYGGNLLPDDPDDSAEIDDNLNGFQAKVMFDATKHEESDDDSTEDAGIGDVRANVLNITDDVANDDMNENNQFRNENVEMHNIDIGDNDSNDSEDSPLNA